MDAGDAIRMAWEADRNGRSRLRDALLTLAVTESQPDDAWTERCRTRLVSDRPDHFLAQFTSVAVALNDPRVILARERLRLKYPESRVHWLLLKARAARGPYLGRVESIEAMLEDLAGPSAEVENIRRDAAQASRGPIHLQKAARPVAFALSYPPMPWASDSLPFELADDREERSTADFATYYLTILLAIACLLATVQEHRSAND